jgi:hypothetical protein
LTHGKAPDTLNTKTTTTTTKTKKHPQKTKNKKLFRFWERRMTGRAR